MLVLRRRASEAIVFDGGLVVTLVDVIDHHAWLAFASPSVAKPVVVSVLCVDGDTTCIGVRNPASLRRTGNRVEIDLAPDELAADDQTAVTARATNPRPMDTVLLINTGRDDLLSIEGLTLTVSSVEQGRAVLSAKTSETDVPIGVSVFSVSGAEVKIGIEAPDHVRVYREEVWLAMLEANAGAASAGVWSSDDLASLAGATLGGSKQGGFKQGASEQGGPKQGGSEQGGPQLSTQPLADGASTGTATE